MDLQRRPGLVEALIVWALFGLTTLAVFVTYWRVPAANLYHTSGSGFEAGVSRALVYLGYPVALATIPLAVIAAAQLATRWAWSAAAASIVLCATIGIPGVVDQGDLDARPVNGLAAAGVAIALALTVLALVREGVGPSGPFGRGDVLRIGAAMALLLVSLPWLFAELGFYVSDAPVLGRIFLAKEMATSAGGEPSLRAVHLGSHHGMDGVLLAISALVLLRVPPRLASRGREIALTAYLALMLVYGLANALQDFWTEQLVKRGTLSATIPSLIRPTASWAWAAMLAAVLLICLGLLRVVRVDSRQGGGSP
jgi:hypothetical protein